MSKAAEDRFWVAQSASIALKVGTCMSKGLKYIVLGGFRKKGGYHSSVNVNCVFHIPANIFYV